MCTKRSSVLMVGLLAVTTALFLGAAPVLADGDGGQEEGAQVIDEKIVIDQEIQRIDDQVTDPGAERASRRRIVPRWKKVDGRDYGEWTAAWWQWALAFPPDTNPILDETGEFADLGQSGAMYFLAGTFGGDPVVRNITIKSDKHIMLTPLNVWWDTTPGIENPLELPDPLSVQDLRDICDWFMDRGVVAVTIDSREVRRLVRNRIKSPVFSMNFDPEFAEWYGEDYPPYQRTAVSDGFWAILRPLRPGKHVIHIRGELPDFGFVVDVTYNITVEGE